MYQPTNGDTVTVTRTSPDGHAQSWTGVLSQVLSGGFRLTGTRDDGYNVDTYMASSSELQRDHGVTQTVTPVAAP